MGRKIGEFLYEFTEVEISLGGADHLSGGFIVILGDNGEPTGINMITQGVGESPVLIRPSTPQNSPK